MRLKNRLLIGISCAFVLCLTLIMPGCGIGAGDSFPDNTPLNGTWSGTLNPYGETWYATINTLNFICTEESGNNADITGNITISDMAGLSTGTLTGTMRNNEVNFVASFANNNFITFAGFKTRSGINGTYRHDSNQGTGRGNFLLTKKN
jgi:hypothetical protein